MNAIVILAIVLVLIAAVFAVAIFCDTSPHGPGHGCKSYLNRDERRREASWL